MAQQKTTQNAQKQALSLPEFTVNSAELQNGTGKGRSRKIWIAVITLIIVIAVVIVVGRTALGWLKPPATTYQYDRVNKGALNLTVNATGPLQSPATYNLVAGGNARISEIDTKVGQQVMQGQVLARLDPTALQDAVNQAQATVDTDQHNLDHTQSLCVGWCSSANQFQITQAQDALRSAQLQLATAQHNLDNATVKAPHQGVVTAINGTVGGNPGTVTSSGASSASSGTFIQIVDLSTLQIQANVNESDTANLKVGNPVTFTVNAYGDRQFQGKVSSISPNGVSSSNVVTYPVTIDIDMQSAQGVNLLPNMTAGLIITVAQRQDVLLISANAVNFARQANSGGTGSPSLISRQATDTALNQAQQMLSTLQSQNPAIAADNPTAAFVLQDQQGGGFKAVPVVLGLNDGNNYEVLAGLNTQDEVVIGNGSSGSPNNGNNGNNGSGAAPAGKGG